ncbi:hypothetical protein COW46_01185 [Candidatus Gracilibacteria bacterium CG17_big_fil_post_rev_8_21_14_2_50_48_13]|nr:MAG: hypothetical protein COW46_01185 [Candidatus Gracilibacteria bacterium CG17_big_fil_post_rev_8_21_14_2_50_48_13]
MKTLLPLLCASVLLASCGGAPATTGTSSVLGDTLSMPSTGETMSGISMTGFVLSEHDDHSMMIHSDQEFLVEMVAHHQEAVDASKKLLSMGPTKPQVRSLLSNIITNQDEEIRSMGKMYAQWYGEPLPVSTTYAPMMRSLAYVSPRDAERQFVEDMVKHHEHAIVMAQMIYSITDRPELRTLAENIVRDQSKEITMMRDWLSAW